MIYFLYGENSFLTRLKLREMIEQYRKVRRSGLNLFFFDFQEGGNLEDFFSELQTVPMLSERRLFVIENVLQDEWISGSIFDFLKSHKSEDILVFFETVPSAADNPLFLFLKKNATAQEFKPLSLPSTVQWLKKEVSRLGGKISDEAVRSLVTGLGDDLWALSNEAKKLVCLKGGDIIDAEDINPANQFATNIFQTIEAMASGDKRLALKLVGRHLDQGEPLLYLLAMVVYQFRTLVIVASLLKQGVKQADIPHLSGLKSFVVGKCFRLLKQISLDNLKMIYARISETDFKIKTGLLLPRQGLETLVINI